MVESNDTSMNSVSEETHRDKNGNSLYDTMDISQNVHSHTSFDASNNETTVVYNSDINYDASATTITNYTLNQTIDSSGMEIVNQQGQTSDGTEVTHTTLNTTDPSNQLQITEDLTEVVQVYDDELDASTNSIVNDIKFYASKINCSEFHGKGTIDDYSELFNAAAKIANESKQMQLDVDVEGFEEFGQAADDLSALFNSFIIKLQNVSIINDTNFLTSIYIALKKIWQLSEVFGKFKQTIMATTTIQIPKSAHDTKVIIQGVMAEVDCAMQYINYFVNPTECVPDGAALNSTEQNIINTAVSTIDNWNTLCEEGVSIALSNNPDIQYISQANNELKSTTTTLRNATSLLRSKLQTYNILH
jgi:hypothetical protein